MTIIATHSFRQDSTRPVVLTIAGSDSAAMAGIQMDARTANALGVHAATAITANTAQNNAAVLSINPVAAQILDQQIGAALALRPQAIKIGLLCSREQVEVVVNRLAGLTIPVVYDPVLSSSSGQSFADESLVAIIKQRLLPLCKVVTPNLDEARLLTGLEIETAADRPAAAALLATMNDACWVIKGGHQLSEWVQDYCHHDTVCFWLSQPLVDTVNTRGSGCALSTSIAAAMARGYALRDALVIARMALQQGLRQAVTCNDQMGAVCITGFPTGDWPQLSVQLAVPDDDSFLPCASKGEQERLGLYPVVDRAQWLRRLLPLGISTIQLRVKDLQGEALRQEIIEAITIAREFNCRLFINDFWQLAIELGAYGVHLGQEDLETANLAAIRQAGLRLGLSSHSHFEVARALTLKPSYIACGPTFATTTKDMPWVPHGITGLQYWQRSLDYPLVSIAGITNNNITEVAKTGVSGVAMITAITLASDPERMVIELMEAIGQRPLRVISSAVEESQVDG